MTVRTSNNVYFTVLPPRPTELLGWEVRIFDIDNPNTLLAYVANWKGLSFSDELNGVGGGQVMMRLDDPSLTEPLPIGVYSAGVLEESNIFRVYWDGVERFAFTHDQDNEPEITADEEGGLWVTVSGPGLGSLLGRAAVLPKNWEGYPAPYAQDDKNHVWTATPYGAMFLDLFDRASQRGAVEDMAVGFTAGADSHEQAWVFSADLDLPPGGSLLDLLERWGEVAFDWKVDLDLNVYAWQSYGRHLENEVRFWVGADIRSTEKTSDRREIKNYVVVEASDGSTATAVDAPSIALWRRREVYLTAGEAADVTTAQQYANAALRASKDEAVERVLSVDVGTEGRQPWIDYLPGDFVSLVAGSDNVPEAWTEPEAFRVLVISIGIADETADATCELTIQSKMQAAMVTVMRKLKQLAILREGTAGNVATPQEGTTKSDFSSMDTRVNIVENGLLAGEARDDTNEARIAAVEHTAVNSQPGAYTLVLSDDGKAVEMTSAVDVALTVPPNSTVAFPIGTVIEITQMAGGAITVTAGAGVTIRSASAKYKTGGLYAVASIRKKSTNEWVLAGDLIV